VLNRSQFFVTPRRSGPLRSGKVIDLQLEHVSKRYRIRQDETPKSGLFGRFKRFESKDFWALKDISFEVRRGEVLGIIGHNGAGKSTILKLLSNITAPTKGTVIVNGRLTALLEVGSGFHPELTGRENIYLSGSILDMPRREIARKLDSIVDFAGVRQFIDMPVKRYSSGMFVRLGFSIAAHLNPDILLLDEVLAVGDRAFREKCATRIAELHRAGTTMIYISHDLAAVRALCRRVILLHRGEILMEGPADEAIQRYTEVPNLNAVWRTAESGAAAAITGVNFYDAARNPCVGFSTGSAIAARVEYEASEEIPKAIISLDFIEAQNASIIAQWTTSLGGPLCLNKGRGSVEFFAQELGLQPGPYKVDAHIEEFETRSSIDAQYRCTGIHVEPGKQLRGEFYIPHEWRQVRQHEMSSRA
jgi:ABC-type polysaccharide/polyol phosphate transport system ATPase subunit